MPTEFGLFTQFPVLRQKPMPGARLAQGSSLVSGLVGFWPFLEGSGRTVSNYTQRSPAGVLENSARWGEQTNYGKAIDVRVATARVNAQNCPAFAITGSLTIQCWVYGYSLPGSGNYPRVVSRLNSPSGYQGYEILGAAADAGGGLVQRSMFLQIAKNGALNSVSDVIPVPLGRWVQFVATYDAVSGLAKMYRDGILRASRSAGSNNVGDALDNVYLGGRPAGDSFPGLIDFPAIWNRQLSDQEVYQLYENPFRLFESNPNASRISYFLVPGKDPVDRSLTIAGSAKLDTSVGMGYSTTQTVAAVGTVSLALRATWVGNFNISSVATTTLIGGMARFDTQAIEGFSGISLVPGGPSILSASIAGVSGVTASQITFTVLSLIVSASAALTTAPNQSARIGVSVAGLASFTIYTTASLGLSVPIPAISTIYRGSSKNSGGTDGLHNFLALTVSETTAQVYDRGAPGDQIPTSVGNLSASCTGVFNRTVTQTLDLTQSAQLKKPTEIVDTFHIISQVVTVQRVRNRTVAQTLALTQSTDAKRAIAQNLALTQQVTVRRIRSLGVVQTLPLSQAADRRTVLARGVTQTLVMGQNRLVRSPIIGTIGSSNPTPFEYYQPSAQAILVPSRCLVILGVPSQTVILPCPQFGDTQAPSSSIVLKRTMTGDTYTYVRRTGLQKLKYQFWLGTYKAIELEKFLLDHCHELITLINHKGETWFVNLSNNPFEFTASERWQHKGERHDITLEFEGVQL